MLKNSYDNTFTIIICLSIVEDTKKKGVFWVILKQTAVKLENWYYGSIMTNYQKVFKQRELEFCQR